jgi:hypothetical protein
MKCCHSEDDYERDLKAELMGTPAKNKLKKKVVPSLTLDGKTEVSATTGATAGVHVLKGKSATHNKVIYYSIAAVSRVKSNERCRGWLRTC